MNFDDIEIDGERYELRRAGERVAVEPKVFDLILFLAGNPNRLITKDELIENVWQGRIVSDASLSSAVKSARRALGADVADSRIKTVRGRGFRMELPEEQSAVAEAPSPPRAARVFAQPSFAILVPEGSESWVDDVRRKILAAVARVPFVTPAAPMVLRQIEARGPDDLARALGPGFALDIAVSGAGEKTRLSCLLFDTSSGLTIWTHEAGPFDPSGDTTGMLRDMIVRLEPQLVRATHATLAGKDLPADPRALTMQALGTLSLKGWNRSSFREAETLLRDALDTDAPHPFTYAALALVTALGQEIGMTAPAPDRLEEAISFADRAVDLDGLSPLILGFAGCALCDAGQALRGKTLLQRALDIDADNPQAKAALGTQLLREGEMQAGIAFLSDAIANSARDTQLAVWRSILAMALLRQGDTDAAFQEATHAVAADDRTHLSRVVLAVVLLLNGNTAGALDAWRDAVRVTSDLTPEEMQGLIGRRGVEALRELTGN